MITYILSIDFCILIYTIDETTIIRCLFDDDRIEQSRAPSTMNFNKQQNNVAYVWELQIIATMMLYF